MSTAAQMTQADFVAANAAPEGVDAEERFLKGGKDVGADHRDLSERPGENHSRCHRREYA